jgi:hypothetical protein
MSVDLNETGMLCSRVGYLALGSVVRVFLRLPDIPAQPLACQARVVRCDSTPSPSYGLRFLDLTPADARRLQAYVKTCPRSGHALSWMYRFDS